MAFQHRRRIRVTTFVPSKVTTAPSAVPIGKRQRWACLPRAFLLMGTTSLITHIRYMHEKCPTRQRRSRATMAPATRTKTSKLQGSPHESSSLAGSQEADEHRISNVWKQHTQRVCHCITTSTTRQAGKVSSSWYATGQETPRAARTKHHASTSRAYAAIAQQGPATPEATSRADVSSKSPFCRR